MLREWNPHSAWAQHRGIFTTTDGSDFAIAIELKTGEELHTVAADVAQQLKGICG